MSNKFIRSLTIENFKSIKQLNSFELRNINILIGSNGAGKSNFLSFFSLLKNIIDTKLVDYVHKQGGADSILTYGKKQSDYLDFSIDFEHVGRFELRWEFKLDWTNDDKLYVSVANIYESGIKSLRTGSSFSEINLKDMEIPEHDNGAVKLIKDTALRITKITQYHFHDVSDSSPIKSLCDLVNSAKLLPDGKNIAPFLYRLKIDYPNSYQMIIHLIKSIIPDFADFYFSADLKIDSKISLQWINKNDLDSVYHSSRLSDGSLRFICLATVLLQPMELMPEIVIIDEPELGLHPQALALIASLVQRLSLQKQFIIATQSSNFIDLFEAHDIVVVNKNLDGSSEFIRLDEDELSNWLDEYSLADLWDMNIIGGRP